MPVRRPAQETARLGDEIYEWDIRPHVEASDHGRYVAIDVDSGSWSIADTMRGAAENLRGDHPQAVDVWLLRVGYRAIASIGGGSLRSWLSRSSVSAGSYSLTGAKRPSIYTTSRCSGMANRGTSTPLWRTLRPL